MTTGPIERWVLPNGLIVLYRRSVSLPLAGATLLVRVGSYDEAPSEAGLASFTADMLLQGTYRRSARRIAQDMEAIGASLGAHSSEDHTEMGFVTPPDYLPRALDVMADTVQNASFPVDEISKERAHILAALKSRHDAIFNVAYDRLMRELYGDHPYGRPVDGTLRVIPSITRSDLKAWSQRCLRPDRAILSLVAPQSTARAASAIRRYFGGWKRPAESYLVRRWPAPAAARRDRTLRLSTSFQQAYLMTGMPAPSIGEAGYLPLKVFNTLLGGGMSSRLFVGLRENLGLVYEVSSFFPTRLYQSHWVIYMGLDRQHLPLARRKLNDILERIAERGVMPSEIAQAKNMMRGSFYMEHQSRRRQAWYAAWWEFLGRGADYGKRYLSEIDAVTPAQIKKVAREMLSKPRVTVEVVPK